MAWFRPMGVDAVAYHEETVLGRADDHAGAALDYYGSRGETPLRWGGSGAARLGLSGEVNLATYEAAFGPGGFRDPILGTRLARTTRPGFELVISAHKSVAMLGLAGRVEDMHTILDANTDATMDCLDRQFQVRGGRRGRARRRAPTSGLTYARTRHATSRAGDPAPHDHILVANCCEMLDTKGGFKGLDSAALRELVEAATMVGHLHAAAAARRLGYDIRADSGRKGRSRQWAVVGVSDLLCEQFSKRSDQIAQYMAERGYQSDRAERTAARATRPPKRRAGWNELLSQWHEQMAAAGMPARQHAAVLEAARLPQPGLVPDLTDNEIDAIAAEVLAADGPFMARRKVFGRTRLVAEIAPYLYGRDPEQLDYVLDRILSSDLVVPLAGIESAYEQNYATTEVLAAEHAIAATVERLANRSTTADRQRTPVATADWHAVKHAVAAKQKAIGGKLSAGQRLAVHRVCGSGHAVDVIVGVAGAGKTTVMEMASRAFEAAGHRVIGTSTSGQAAKTLGREASIESRTIRSLLTRLDRHQIRFDPTTVVILDEAGMTADADLLRLVTEIEKTGAKLIMVGDHRQLSAVGPGGALDAVLEHHPEIVTVLDRNLRQQDPAEREALAQLRAGDVRAAVRWYARKQRTQVAPTRTEALAGMVEAWATDTEDGQRTALLAWRREDARDLNRLARNKADELGRLSGKNLETPGGRCYAVGDPVVLLAPNYEHDLRTSQQGTVIAVDHDARSLTLRTDDDQTVTLSGEAIDADHLDLAYALTVHRVQGATYDRVHGFADGGGRELGYVEMSRAGQRTTLHAVADNFAQALDDITADWSHETRQVWVTRAATAAVDHDVAPLPADPAAQRARLVAELEALRRHEPSADRTPEVNQRISAVERAILRIDNPGLAAFRDRLDLIDRRAVGAPPDLGGISA